MKPYRPPVEPVASLGAPVRQLVADLRAGKYKNVVFMVGAGISTAAGIPDFRSPKTGLYANLQKFNLPYPEAVFDIDYLRENPRPFFMLAQEMFPSQFQPTAFHEFMKFVADLGVLKRVYTQNIDTLERRAEIPGELIVEAHGSFNGNHCIDCRRPTLPDEHDRIEQLILAGKVPKCVECQGIVKPNIVFFGEALPARFFEMLETDFELDNNVDLVIVAGTSLQVSPFNQLPDMVGRRVPRYLFNLERVGSLGMRKHDVLVLGSLQDLVFETEHDRSLEEKGQASSDQRDVIEPENEAEKKAATAATKVGDDGPKGNKTDRKGDYMEDKPTSKAENKAQSNKNKTEGKAENEAERKDHQIESKTNDQSHARSKMDTGVTHRETDAKLQNGSANEDEVAELVNKLNL